jgi:sarcosine oxidase
LPQPRNHTTTAAVVGAGVIGLSAARALAEDGFAVTVYERHRVGTPLGSSPGRSRIYRRAYPHPDYVSLSAAAIDLWQRIDPDVLHENGLLIHGRGAEAWADALEECDLPGVWLSPAQAHERFPEAHFDGSVLWDGRAGAVMADEALRALGRGLDVREGVAVDDPRELDADVVVACPGAWLGPMFGLPLEPWLEQVSYFAGAPDGRPSIIDLGDSGSPFFYGLEAPGLGYKIAQDGVARPWDPDRPDRPVDAEQERRIADHVRRSFPGLDPTPRHGEACLYTMTPDSDFVLDVIDGVVVCGGDSGHAFKLAPLLGRMAADLAQGRELPHQARRFATGRLARL